MSATMILVTPEFRRHDCRQANGANTGDQYRIAQARTRLVEYGPGAGSQAAGQRTEQVNRCIPWNLDERIGRNDGMVANDD